MSGGYDYDNHAQPTDGAARKDDVVDVPYLVKEEEASAAKNKMEEEEEEEEEGLFFTTPKNNGYYLRREGRNLHGQNPNGMTSPSKLGYNDHHEDRNIGSANAQSTSVPGATNTNTYNTMFVILLCVTSLTMFVVTFQICRKWLPHCVRNWVYSGSETGNNAFADWQRRSAAAAAREAEANVKQEEPEEKRARLMKELEACTMTVKESDIIIMEAPTMQVIIAGEDAVNNAAPTPDAEPFGVDAEDGSNSLASSQEEANSNSLLCLRGRRTVPNTCAVCLGPYEPLDEVVWSTNMDCPHVYHLDCALDWLVKIRTKPEDEDGRASTPCPCCRREFVMKDYDAQNVGLQQIPKDQDCEDTGPDDTPPSSPQQRRVLNRVTTSVTDASGGSFSSDDADGAMPLYVEDDEEDDDVDVVVRNVLEDDEETRGPIMPQREEEGCQTEDNVDRSTTTEEPDVAEEGEDDGGTDDDTDIDEQCAAVGASGVVVESKTVSQCESVADCSRRIEDATSPEGKRVVPQPEDHMEEKKSEVEDNEGETNNGPKQVVVVAMIASSPPPEPELDDRNHQSPTFVPESTQDMPTAEDPTSCPDT